MEKRICSVEGCNKPHQAKGYCFKHYYQIKRHGRLTPELERPELEKDYVSPYPKWCMVENCNKESKTKGYCMYHYVNLHTTGNPVRPKMRVKGKICSIEGCNKEVKTKGLCQRHYDNFVYHRKKHNLTLEQYHEKKQGV